MHHISPGKYKTIWLVSMCSIISKHTYFLLKVYLHCNLPHFRNVSNTSVGEGLLSMGLTPSSFGCVLQFMFISLEKKEREKSELSQTISFYLISCLEERRRKLFVSDKNLGKVQ